ncbi:hypothetical protein [Leptospira noguchii]|uniref:Putative lipoprotein n=1 Tax=Leptospira noguchii serovar Autumnalis str. ZUN142 TaxID=1085540 RepID=M6UDX5_9LEPT|nr:putative lipoprotein [Leptospira noguchii serovar Autumnalis str. ZUN142]
MKIISNRLSLNKEMFRIVFVFNLLLIVLFVGSCKKEAVIDAFAYDETYEPKQWDKLSIVDYYYLLPYSWSIHGNASYEYKKAFLEAPLDNRGVDGKESVWEATNVSLSSGAISVRQVGGSGGEGYSKEYVMWKRKSDSDLIGINDIHCTMGGCVSEITFLTFKNRKWYPVTQQVFPGIEDQEIEYLKSQKYKLNSEAEYPSNSDTPIRCSLPWIGKDIQCGIDFGYEDNEFEKTSKIKYVFQDNRFVLEEK